MIEKRFLDMLYMKKSQYEERIRKLKSINNFDNDLSERTNQLHIGNASTSLNEINSIIANYISFHQN